MAPHPGLDTAYVKEKARKDLLDLLEGVRGKKNLVIQQALAGCIDSFVFFSTLKQYGVESVFFLENTNVTSSQRNVVFLARGENSATIVSITEQIKQLQRSSSIEHEFTVLLVPRRTLVSNKIFEDAGILGDIEVKEFPLHFLPLEPDLLSLELSDAFTDLYLHKDPTCVYAAARALMLFQEQHGLFPRILGKGENAHRLMEILLRMRAETNAEESDSRIGMMPSSTVESLIVIDREIDFGTPLLTQLTYEGLIDETYGIKDRKAEIDTSIVGRPPEQGAESKVASPTRQNLKRKILLDSSDKLFTQLRDCNFAIVGAILNRTARQLQTDYESRHVAKSTSELRDFVNKLPGYQAEQQSLKVHTNLAEDIMKLTRTEFFGKALEVQQNLAAGADPTAQHEAIEELIARGAPLHMVLRLLCLESCCAGGLRQSHFDHFRTLVQHAYGFQHLLTLDRLEKMQLLVSRSSTGMLPGMMPGIPGAGGGGGGGGGGAVGNAAAASAQRNNYAYLRRALHLIVEEVNETDPNDIAYVYSGYAPLSVRVVQCVVQKEYLQGFARSAKAAAAAAAAGNNAGGGDATNGTGGGGGGLSTAAHSWQGFEDAMKAMRGPTFNKVQKGEEAATKARSVLSGASGSAKKTVVVMFLGGITRTEIAALRFLAKGGEDKGKKILICTTGVVTGNGMIDAALQQTGFEC